MSTISFLLRQSCFPAALDWNRFQSAIVESAAEIEYMTLRGSEDSSLAQAYPVGVAFGPASELRWRRKSGGLHLVLISDDGQVLPGAEPVDLRPVPRVQEQPLQCFLWGEWDFTSDCWVDRRIPRALRYPGQEGVRMALELKQYTLKVDAPAVGLNGIEIESTPTLISRYVGIVSAG